ncbi:MAG: lactate racemase domain-containing protein [candidate division Zixibacteria bacterium]
MPSVAFGNEQHSFSIESGDTLIIAEPSDDVPLLDETVFQERLKEAGFDSFIENRPLVIVNDAFRPTPTGTVLSHLKKWYPEFQADYLIACGNHPAPDDDDVAMIFSGYKLGEGERIFSHDSRNPESMRNGGEFERRPVLVNKLLFEYPAIIIIGSVEPHYFAGFTGGRKSIIPGLADFETTRRNHALAVSPEAQPLRLNGNPMAENLQDLIDIISLPPLISIQLVLNRNHKIIDAFAGDLKTSFDEAVSIVEDLYAYKASHSFDLVIAEMLPPLDRNLYQLQKAVENCQMVVADGGTVLAVSSCSEGIGNDEFYRLAGKLSDESMVLSHAAMDNPPMGIHKLSRIIMMSKRINVRALTGLKPEIVEQIYWEPAVSIDAEIQKLRYQKENLNILIVRDAGQMVAK